ncbi:hypothetical protein [Salibacterium lacus]|uniref:Uncharacterized protein n=1 Tax=Salibacterium lacus TaxID=1898109 RepID=A0ABW5SZT8_9BACI
MKRTPDQADKIQRHIDRLTHDLRIWKSAYTEMADHADELKAENKRLRQAIAMHPSNTIQYGEYTADRMLREAIRDAGK